MPGSAWNQESSATPARVPSYQELERQRDAFRDEYLNLERQLATPPAGWFVFGSHIDQPWVRLEFWGNDAGVPLWERPLLTPGDMQ